jgi:hypothetical protein
MTFAMAIAIINYLINQIALKRPLKISSYLSVEFNRCI